MNIFFVKDKNSKKNINISLILSLVPLLIYGFYKNGIKLYSNELVGVSGLFKPLLFDLIGFIIGIIVYYVYERLIKKNDIKLFRDIFSSFYPFYGLLIASLISINSSMLLFSVITFVVMFISLFISKFRVNVVSLTVLVIILITHLMGEFTYLNAYELNNVLHLDPLDYFMGLGSGGINTTCGFLLVGSLIYLFSKNYYKKEILVSSVISYCLLMFLYCFFKTDIKLFLDSIFSNGVLFSFIYIGTLFSFSPISIKGRYIYGLMVGVITFLLYLVYPSLAAIGAILIVSLCTNVIDKLVER